MIKLGSKCLLPTPWLSSTVGQKSLDRSGSLGPVCMGASERPAAYMEQVLTTVT